MTAHPSATSVASDPGIRYLEDLFLHLRGCSRSVTDSHTSTEAACVADLTPSADDAIIAHENVVADFLARVAPAAVGQMRRVRSIAPGYAEDAHYPLSDLEAPQVDALIRPIFEEAGIADDFMPAAERFPDLAIENEGEGR